MIGSPDLERTLGTFTVTGPMPVWMTRYRQVTIAYDSSMTTLGLLSGN
nr:hypothetical protein [Candidatus Vondammii sp. HM_W22]